MPERAGSAVYVDFLMRQVEIPHCSQRDHGKRFINLEQINFAESPAGALGKQPDGADGRSGKQAGSLSVRGVACNHGLAASRQGPFLASERAH